MKISAYLRLFFFVNLSIIAAGCILPIPHTRITRPDCEGCVTDALTGKPISNATVLVGYEGGTNIVVNTDSLGQWAIPGEKTWHAAVFIGVPMSYSLFPRFEGFILPSTITIEAEGYDKFVWSTWLSPSELSKFTEGLPLEDVPVVDPKNVQLKRKALSP